MRARGKGCALPREAGSDALTFGMFLMIVIPLLVLVYLFRK